MNLQKQQAYEILKEWKGDDYVFGLGVMDQLGKLVQRFGRRALVVASGRHSGALIQIGLESMKEAGVEHAPIRPGKMCTGWKAICFTISLTV